MNRLVKLGLLLVLFPFITRAQSIVVEVQSAFVWGIDAANGATSSIDTDPLTGTRMEVLSYHGIKVSHYAIIPPCNLMNGQVLFGAKCHAITNTIIVNNSGHAIQVRYKDSTTCDHLPITINKKWYKKWKDSDLWTGHIIPNNSPYSFGLFLDSRPGDVSSCGEWRQSFFIDGHDFVFRVAIPKAD